jgi:hypothetical protein
MSAQRPRVYLAVILPTLALGGAVAFGLLSLYARQHGLRTDDVSDAKALLIFLPTFFLWIPLALVLSNVVLKTIRPLRIVAETYASTAARPGYAASQRQLLKVFGWLAVFCVPLILAGWWI